MTEYEVIVDNRVFTIKFTTDKQESAETVRDICKDLVEKDKPVPKVKPCPFCGSNDRVCYDVSLETEGVMLGLIGCNGCHLTIKHRFHVSYGKKNAEISLIETWNSRMGK